MKRRWMLRQWVYISQNVCLLKTLSFFKKWNMVTIYTALPWTQKHILLMYNGCSLRHGSRVDKSCVSFLAPKTQERCYVIHEWVCTTTSHKALLPVTLAWNTGLSPGILLCGNNLAFLSCIVPWIFLSAIHLSWSCH